MFGNIVRSRRVFQSLTAKFLLCLVPVFLALAAICTLVISSYDRQIAVFSSAEISAAANTHQGLQYLFIAAAFITSLVTALIGFRIIVETPLKRFHASIRRISETGERLPVDARQSGELGEIITEFNEMIEHQTEREGVLEQANATVGQLNRTLEDRVRVRTDQLLENEKSLRRLIENFNSGIYIHADFKPLYANRTLLEMFGLDDLGEFMSLESTALMLAPEERERILGYHRARLEGGKAPKDYDFWALRQNGEKFMANNRSFAVDWEGKRAVCTVLFDLTERQSTEQSLAEQQRLIASLMETTQEGFWFIDLRNETTDVNPAMCKILGRPREDIIGKSIMDFVDEENAEIFRRQIERRSRGLTGSYEISLQQPDGTRVPCLNNATPLLDTAGEKIGSVGIWADISEIKMTQRSLEHEKERAEAASVAKSEFLAIASHELRTPMNGVLGMADLMMGSELSDEQRERLRIIIQSGEALMGLLNDILDISKIEAGGLELEERHFDLEELLESVAALMGSRARQKGLTYKNNIGPEVPQTLMGDVKRLRQVLNNIVGNAVKFTRSGQIAISVSRVESDSADLRVRFEVADTGVGISDEAQDRIFEKFTQADSSTTRRFGGTGLGLAICKELVELMEGEIGVDSMPGEGSCFWFTAKLGIGDQSKIVAERDHRRPIAAPAPLRKLCILVAEDNTVNQEIARQTLEDAGHTVTVVPNGHEAVAAVKANSYDVVLMDVHMPEMDGPTATQEIRALPTPMSDVPIIALTADAMSGDREKFLKVGMNDHVAKPFDNSRLFATIGRHIDGPGPRSNSAGFDRESADTMGGPDQSPTAESGLDADVYLPIRNAKPDLWQRLVRLYLDNTPKDIAKLEYAVEGGDARGLQMAAHTMKSSSANVGAMNLSALCAELETASLEGDMASGADLLTRIQQEYEIVAVALQSSTVKVSRQ